MTKKDYILIANAVVESWLDIADEYDNTASQVDLHERSLKLESIEATICRLKLWLLRDNNRFNLNKFDDFIDKNIKLEQAKRLNIN